MCETNIIALHDQIPHISLPHSSFLRSRPHSRRHDVCLATPTSPPLLLLLLSLKVFLLKWRDDLFFVKEEKMAFFFYRREKKRRLYVKTTNVPNENRSCFLFFRPSSGHPRWFGETLLFSLFPDAAADNTRPAIKGRARIERRR